MKINYKAVVISLIVLLAVAFGYIGYQEFQKNEVQIYNTGFENGATQALSAILERAKICQPFTINAEDGTSTNLIAIECLQEK